MKTKLLQTLLPFLILLTIPLTTKAYDFTVDSLRYDILTDSTVEVTYLDYYGDNSSYVSGDLIIPSTVSYNDTLYSVTSIGYGAFSKCTGLSSVVIPSSVTKITDHSFKGCKGLSDIVIPKSVKTIGWHAFEGCTGLTSIQILNPVVGIGCYAFNMCYNANIKVFLEPYKSLSTHKTRDNCQNWKSLILIGYPVYNTISYSRAYQESIDLKVKLSYYYQAPEGYNNKESTDFGIKFGSKYYSCKNDEIVRLKNLKPNTEYTFNCYTKYSDGTILVLEERKITT